MPSVCREARTASSAQEPPGAVGKALPAGLGTGQNNGEVEQRLAGTANKPRPRLGRSGDRHDLGAEPEWHWSSGVNLITRDRPLESGGREGGQRCRTGVRTYLDSVKGIADSPRNVRRSAAGTR